MARFENVFYRLMHWETWDWRVKYIPLVPLWTWHCIRSRSFWFFTPSNPSLLFGGFEGETKQAINSHLPTEKYPNTFYITALSDFKAVRQLVDSKFKYPIAVKPNIGRMGFMFRVINNDSELRLYHEKMTFDYLIQDFVKYPLEVSVFYYRFPDKQKGVITGFVKKEFLQVIGNGSSTLLELLKNYPRIRFRLDEMKSKHREHLHLIIPEREIFYLSYALNLSRGGKLVSLANEIDDQLLKVFDDLNALSKTLYYGRYDIKCQSIKDLKQGKNFSILEYNGCGAEPHHVYGNGFTLVQACRILAQHWNVLYNISSINYKNGVCYVGFADGWKLMRACRKHFAVLRKLDSEFPVF